MRYSELRPCGVEQLVARLAHNQKVGGANPSPATICMKKFLEFFQQQDGAFCAMQLAIVGGFITFWVGWLIVVLKLHSLPDCPTGLAGLLSAMLAAKVWKDYVDYKGTPATTTAVTTTAAPVVPVTTTVPPMP